MISYTGAIRTRPLQWAQKGAKYMEPLEPEIFQNGIWYELRGEQYYPCLLPPEPDHTEDELLETIIQQMAKARASTRI